MARQPDEQNIRSRARRRLIGAIALALAVVVILPMVLDSEPKVTGKDIELRIPEPDKAGEFVPGVSGVSEVQAESAVSLTAVSDVSTVPDGAAAASGKITLVEAKPETANQTATGKQAEAKQLEVKKSADKPAEAKTAETKSTETKPPEMKPVETKQADKAAATYVVQVGAFSNSGTATQEANKLKAWGFKAYTELIAGTTRVRVGPYVDRSKADEVRQLLEKHGLHPAVTAVK
ncbi:MAG: SPOR domain-containing protein [Proteobacteria bacterium]|nr:SPOR domain-containing protein [Pseudomonadota bacterium]